MEAAKRRCLQNVVDGRTEMVPGPEDQRFGSTRDKSRIDWPLVPELPMRGAGRQGSSTTYSSTEPSIHVRRLYPELAPRRRNASFLTDSLERYSRSPERHGARPCPACCPGCTRLDSTPRLCRYGWRGNPRTPRAQASP